MGLAVDLEAEAAADLLPDELSLWTATAFVVLSDATKPKWLRV